MAYTQVKTIFDSTRAYHQLASDHFADLAGHCQATRTDLMLEYLSQHERKLAQAIEQAEQEAPKKLLSTWVQSNEDPAHLIKRFRTHALTDQDATFDELIERGLEIDEQVIRVYKELYERCDQPWIKQVFENLVNLEREEEKQFAKQSLRGMDL